MKEYLILAWRNIWRNKRRTIITIASVFFAMFFALVMRSGQNGSYEHMTKSVVENFIGYIQIHNNGYWKDKSLDNGFEFTSEIAETVQQTDKVTAVVPRIESFALASNYDLSKGILLVGMDPESEKNLTDPESKLAEGNYLQKGSKGVLVAKGLAEYLKIDIHDTLTLISLGYHGVSADGLYVVEGILEYKNPDLNRRLVYMDLNECQEFYSMPRMITSLVLNIEHSDDLHNVAYRLKHTIDTDAYEVMTWREISPELVQQIEGDQYGGYLMLGILYIIIGFGVFGTVLMMTNERRREFGVMIAVGMRKAKLIGVVAIEMLLIGILGIIAGITGSIPLIVHFYRNPIKMSGEMAANIESYGMEPIMPFALYGDFYFAQSMIVFVIFMIAITYPILSILKVNPVKAMRA